MDDYTLNSLKLKHINIDLEKFDIIYNDDDSSTLDAADRLEDLITLFKQSRIKEYYPFIRLMKK